jgi:hypothetical protein
MKKTSITEHLSAAERRGAIEAALKGGMEPADVFKAVLSNVYGVAERKKQIIYWGGKMGLDANESLRVAQQAHLIASVRTPTGADDPQKPPRKNRA